MSNFDIRARVRSSSSQGDIYEHVIAGLYSSLMPSNGVAVDGGASTGWHTFGMAKILTSGVVHSFEPSPEIFKIHKARAAAWGERVIPNQVALGDFVGESEFNFFNEVNPKFPNDRIWNSGLSGLKSDADRLKLGHVVLRVPVTTLDDYFAAHDVRGLDFVKLDVEGGEFHAMKGGLRTLDSMRPLVAFEDGGPDVAATYRYSANDFVDLIDSVGYELFDILGEPYSASNWVARDRWRPFYSLAIPRDYAAKAELGSIIDAAVRQRLG